MDHQSDTPASAAPVISPSDLVAIIAKAQERGFSVQDPARRGLVEDAAAFRPNDFAAIGRAAAAAAPAPTGTPAQPSPQSAAIPRTADAPARTAVSAPASLPEATRSTAPTPQPDIEELRAAAHAEGYRAGHAAGLAEATAAAKSNLDVARDEARIALLAAASALTAARPDQEDQLSRALSQAVLRLASERAGLAIDAHPEAFAARLRSLSERVSQGVRDIRLALHPADLALVEPHLGAQEAGATVTLINDPSLSRGDAVVTAPGLRLADLLAPVTAPALP